MKLLTLPSQGGLRLALQTSAVFRNSTICTGLPRQSPHHLCRKHSFQVPRQPGSSSSYRTCTKPEVLTTTVQARSLFNQRRYHKSLTTAASVQFQFHRPTGKSGSGLGRKMFHSSTDSDGGVHAGGSSLQPMEVASNIFAHAVSSVLPHQMIEKNLDYEAATSTLRVASREYLLRHNVHVVGFGKAVLGMARALEDSIGDHVVDGVVSIPVGSRDALEKAGLRDMLLPAGSKIRVLEGAGDNLPDEAAMQAAREIAEIVQAAGPDDILVVLISGGGSALLPYPEPPLTLEDTLTVTRLLARSGVTILDLNLVRKQLERLKGGGLARLARPAKVVSLILSDIVGDDLGFIASGPTVADTSTAQNCLDLFQRFHVTASVPASVMTFLQAKAATGQASAEDFSHVTNVLIGTNRIACEAACSKSSSLGFLPYVLSTELCGEAKSVDSVKRIEVKIEGHRSNVDVNTNLLRARLLSEFGLSENSLREIDRLVLKAQQSDSARGVCVVAGGETTVTVRGKGKGGRNQEMALAAGMELHRLSGNNNTVQSDNQAGSSPTSSAAGSDLIQPSAGDLVFLSGGTDGQDGPTSAAGGIVDGNFLARASQAGLDVGEYLANNDSFTLLSRLGGGSNLVVTGLTGTNVMDLQILLVQLRQS
ncbi:hypothetical protein EGW08_011606 [Elysia chlorotica]|uniref:Glycerate kinase n=1 Tax=Elysia chlorotica TaxID=188477 RepID=A0A3S1C1X0_ELYCH|nr:hypothetical protein EGW08_011606 [Elysia chlorotica]